MACLYGWIDWGNDGEFGNGLTLATEASDATILDRIIDGELIVSAGTHSFTFPVPSIADKAITYYVRFRLYPADPGGVCSHYADTTYQKFPNFYSVVGGEIEDYVWGYGSTAVTVVNYHSSLAQPFGLNLQWTTVNEVNTSGFNIYRAEQPGGVFTQINVGLFDAHNPGGSSGSDYTYTDSSALPGVKYLYKLEHVAADLSTSDYGNTEGEYYHVLLPSVIR